MRKYQVGSRVLLASVVAGVAVACSSTSSTGGNDSGLPLSGTGTGSGSGSGSSHPSSGSGSSSSSGSGSANSGSGSSSTDGGVGDAGDAGSGSGSSGSGSGSSGSGSGSSGSGSGSSGSGSGSGSPFCEVADGGALETERALACGQAAPRSVAVSNGVVFWTNAVGSTGSVVSTPETGGPITTLASNQNLPSALAADASNVYWIAYQNLLQAPRGGGTILTLDTSPGGFNDLAIDSTSVYYATPVQLRKVSIGGGAGAVLANTTVSVIAVDASNVYWGSLGNAGNGTLLRTSKQGGVITTLTTTLAAYPTDLVTDGTSVYFVNQPTGTGAPASAIQMVPVGASNAVATTVQGGFTGVGCLTLSATDLYFAAGVTGTNGTAVSKIPTGGGSVSTLGTFLIGSAGACTAVDSNGLYVAGADAVWWVSPP